MACGGGGGDEAKQLLWLLTVAHARVIFAKTLQMNTTADLKVDSNMQHGRLTKHSQQVTHLLRRH